MLRPLTTVEKRLILIGLVVAFVVGATTYNALRTYMVWRLSAQVRLLELDVQTLKDQEQARQKAIEQWQAMIERTLFVEPSPKLPPPPRRPSVVEQWQLNRDRELRDRLRALERWRYESER